MTSLKKAAIQYLNILPWCFVGGDEEIYLPAVSQMNASMFVWYVIVQMSCPGLK